MARRPERTVLHVLPHPGGGGETYVDALAGLDGYRQERTYLATEASPAGQRAAILRRTLDVQFSARRYDLLHVHGEVAGALSLPALAVLPSVVTLHGLNLLRRVRGLARAAAAANLGLVLRVADRAICVSRSEFEDVRRAVGGATLAGAVVIHNGVRPAEPVTADERSAARLELGVSASAAVGVWIGSLEEHKDPLTPIRAAGEVARTGAPVVLLVAGDGRLRPVVEAAAHEEGGSVVRVLGHRTDVRRLLAAADFFVLSSRREGFSFALLEAMALGLAPVVSDAPANLEAVGDTGVVVPFGDDGAFADAFRRLLDYDGLATRGQRARERVERNFRSDEMVDRTREVYDELLGPSR